MYKNAFNLGMPLVRLPQKLLLIMKLTTFILIITLVQVSAKSFSQISLNEQNKTVAEVLKKIEQQSGFVFLYDYKDLKDARVSVTIKNVSIESALDVTLKSLGLTYQIGDTKTITISPKAPSFLENIIAKFKAIDVSGRVVDAVSGEGLPGASVKVRGMDRVTSTDKDGSFFLSDVTEDAVLEISYIGYVMKTVRAGKDIGTIRMELATSDLQEVTINKGYYAEKKELSTGSVVKITAEEIERSPVNNPLLALQGRVAGLIIEESSGKQGSNLRISLRGKNSLQNGVDPFYIIDGVPYYSQSLGSVNGNSSPNGVISPFYSISSTDIESIEVLKDADATAIYGSRGANGVILITTKKGRQGKTVVTANLSTGGSKVPHFLELMNTQQYLKMRHQAFKNDNRQITSAHYDINGRWDTTRYTDWQKELIGRTAQMTNAQASVSGGKENTQYLFSGSLQKQTTVFPGDNNSKTASLLFSITNESPNDKLKSRFSANYVINDIDGAGGDMTGQTIMLAPNAPPLYNESGELNWDDPLFQNPIAYTKSKYIFNSYNLISNLSLSYEVLPRLEIKTTFGINSILRDEKSTNPSSVYDPVYNLGPEYSSLFMSSGANRSWIAEPQISWTNKNTKYGSIAILFGGTFQSQETTIQSFRYDDFPSNSLIEDPNSARVADIEGSTKLVYKYMAGFGRINYSFREKYILNLTGRRDGSSRFGPGKQFATLGAIGAAWIFSNENIVKQSSILSFGKLRGSFGVTGNDQIGDYQFIDTYQSYASYEGGASLVPTKLFNPQYSWETTRKFEAALELGFYKNRINMAVAYYNNRSSNQLVSYKLGATSGFSSILRNFPATIENTGLEIELNSAIIKGAFNWTASLNFSVPKNKLISFPNLESSSYANQYVEGRSLTVIKRFLNTGLDPTSGLYTVQDMNNDGQITFADQLSVSELRTKYHGGISNSLSYKGWSLDILLQFVNKNAFSPMTAFPYPGRLHNQLASILNDSWTANGQSTTYQRFSTNRGDVSQAYENHIYSDNAIVSASFLRIKNVSLAYKFPKKWVGNAAPTVFFRGQNLFTATSYDGFDPETGSSYTLPTLRTIIIGANISL